MSSRESQYYKFDKEGHYSSVCRSTGKSVKVHEVQVQPAASAAQYQNCIPDKYTAVCFNNDVHTLKTATVKSLNNPWP